MPSKSTLWSFSECFAFLKNVLGDGCSHGQEKVCSATKLWLCQLGFCFPQSLKWLLWKAERQGWCTWLLLLLHSSAVYFCPPTCLVLDWTEWTWWPRGYASLAKLVCVLPLKVSQTLSTPCRLKSGNSKEKNSREHARSTWESWVSTIGVDSIMLGNDAEKRSLITALDFGFLGSLSWLYNFLFLSKYTSQEKRATRDN